MGDRLGHLKRALALVDGLPGTELKAVSSVYETEPVGKLDQPRFLNAVAEVATGFEPRQFLHALLLIEDVCGRVRTERWGPRTLDLDIIVYEGVEMSTGALTLPHPRASARAFVLVPLAEIAPDLEFPGSGLTVSAMAEGLDLTEGDVEKVGEPPELQ